MEQTAINGSAPLPSLPQEIVPDILIRLPAKSLMRFRCVSTYWENLFKTPCFIAAHLRRSQQNPSFIYSLNYIRTKLPLRLLDCEMQLRDVQKPPEFHCSARSSVHIIGSSNGLLCFSTVSIWFVYSLSLWNPVTGHSRYLPVSRTHTPVYGFGFSALVNDYKIIAIHGNNSYADHKTVCGVEVYSVNKDSWKGIEVGNLEGGKLDMSYTGSPVSCNGAIYFPRFELDNKEVIVSFDIATEVFTLTPLPPMSGCSNFKLTVYEDKLALILTKRAIRAPSSKLVLKVDLWVMEEDIVPRWNWIKKFTSDAYRWEFRPRTIWRNEIVMSGIGLEGDMFENEYHICMSPQCHY